MVFVTSISTSLQRRLKHAFLLVLDAIAATSAFAIAWLLFQPNPELSELLGAVPIILLIATAIFYFTGASRRVWRFFSIADATNMAFSAALVAAASFLALSMTTEMKAPMSVFYVCWLMLSIFMAGLRFMRRSATGALKFLDGSAGLGRAESAPKALIAGAPEAVDLALRQIESGFAGDFVPIGVLDETEIDVRRTLRGVPILGGLDSLDRVYQQLATNNKAPTKLIVAASQDALTDVKYVRLASRAAALGIKVMRASLSTGVEDSALQLRPFDISELLGRTPAALDADLISRAIADRRVLVTGAGGSIGGELVRQISTYSPKTLVLLDSCEFNLYKIDQELRENFPKAEIVSLMCDIRNRNAIMNAFAEYRPEVVFNAAALKHVPLVELNPCAGAETNVLGTRNIADAAKKFDAIAMVQVSTDKAVDPVGIMGATKRIGELYCQALDLEGIANPSATRFMTVRFGNVLGSSGSVVPLFFRQLRERVPLTVTDPEMKRYFMTVHEAVQLVLQSTQAAFDKNINRGRIFVLDMGEPVKVIDIAERMIRLSGLEPNIDVKIEIVGMRPGEKLIEELFDAREERLPSEAPNVFEAEPSPVSLTRLEIAFERLENFISLNDVPSVKEVLFSLIDSSPKDAKSTAAENANIAKPANDENPSIAASGNKSETEVGENEILERAS